MRGVFVDPPVVHQTNRYGIQEVAFFPTETLRGDETCSFQQAQMLHHADSRHVDVRFEFAQGATVPLEQQVEQVATRRVGERLEYEVVVHPGQE